MTEQAQDQQPQSQISTDAAATQQAATTSQAPAWHEQVSEEYKGVVEAKGWSDINDVLRSYKNMEQFAGKMGSERAVFIPDPEDAEGWNKVYTKLGRPEAANGYEYDVSLDGLDEIGKKAVQSNLDAFSNIAFEAGLNKQQAKAVQAKWDAYVEEQASAMEQQSALQAKENIEKLQKEWGQVYDQNLKYAQLAAKKYGLTEDVVAKLEGVAGLDRLMNMLAEIGSDLSEDGYIKGGDGVSQAMSPKQAKAELDGLMADPDYSDPYKNPARHKMLRGKAKDLYAALYPEQQQ
jgi:hypothetical protein